MKEFLIYLFSSFILASSFFIYYSWGETVTVGYFKIEKDDVIEKKGEKFLKLKNREFPLTESELEEIEFGKYHKVTLEWNTNFKKASNIKELKFDEEMTNKFLK